MYKICPWLRPTCAVYHVLFCTQFLLVELPKPAYVINISLAAPRTCAVHLVPPALGQEQCVTRLQLHLHTLPRNVPAHNIGDNSSTRARCCTSCMFSLSAAPPQALVTAACLCMLRVCFDISSGTTHWLATCPHSESCSTPAWCMLHAQFVLLH